MCHNAVRGDYNSAWQFERWHEATILARSPFVNVPVLVLVDSALEAAVATGCACVNEHCPALSDPSPPITWKPPSHWTPEEDQS